MYFRCTSCLAATWIGSDHPPVTSDRMTCHECGRSFVADPVPELGSTEGSHYRYTASFAGKERIDLATAYSFLLGLIGREEMTVAGELEPDDPALDEEEVQAVESLGMEEPALDLDEEELRLVENLEIEEPAPKAGPMVVTFEPPSYDPAFRNAVARGRLSIEEAMRRGDRNEYAKKLSERHKLSMDLAFAVADGRITLYQAHRRQETGAAQEKHTPASSGGVIKGLAALALVAAVILGLTWLLSQEDPRRHAPTKSTRVTNSPADDTQDASVAPPDSDSPSAAVPDYSSTRIFKDEDDHVTRIEGLAPRAVLLAYCIPRDRPATCEPLDIVDTVPPSREARLGTFRLLDTPHEIHGISIQRDRFSRLWVAGSGEQPIPHAPWEKRPGNADSQR